ncbi:hypothetical protein [Clostridium perfringens]|uniref:hypothetical protein n=1 Tax=Clostridium perfringens TaxID=1502 RepID=UPI0018E4B9A7|nr:hypothetical protein [Clostridium perfringens]MBI5987306.1 hypothetical protein [Clostridium perfringens]MBI6054704.1 hypothetical protein [Clostridium perfringens]
MSIKKPTSKQLETLESCLRKSQYNLVTGKEETLTAIECSILIDFLLNNYVVKETDWKGNKLDDKYLRKNKILVEECLVLDLNKKVGAPTKKALDFLYKLTKENRYKITCNREDLTAKLVYQLTNHILDKEPNPELAKQYLEDTFQDSIGIEELPELNMYEAPELNGNIDFSEE